MGGGFSFDNPNPLWMDDISKAVAEGLERYAEFQSQG